MPPVREASILAIQNIHRYGYWVALIVTLSTLAINLLTLNGYQSSLGTDTFVLLWPIGRALGNSGSLFEVFEILISGYMGEDHLFPVLNIFAYIIFEEGRDPVLAIRVFALTVYIFTILGMGLAVYVLWRDLSRLTIFLALVACNITLFSDNVIGPHHSIGILIATWSFCFLCLFLNTKNNWFLFLSTLLLVLSTMASETSFILIPFYLVLIKFLRVDGTASLNSTRKIWASFLVCATTVPYFLTHYIIYGTLLPRSRHGAVEFIHGPATDVMLDLLSNFALNDYMAQNLVYSTKLIISLFSIWVFGIFRTAYDAGMVQFVVIIVLITCFVLVIHRWRIYSHTGAVLVISLFSMIAAIVYTARYGHGLWMFAGLILNIAIADVLAVCYLRISKNKILRLTNQHGYFSSILLVPLLLSVNSYTDPHANLEKVYGKKQQEEYAGYRAINQSNDKLVVIRLPDATPTMYSPMQFWMGNKMYHGEPALVYFKKWNEMGFRNMYIETHYNLHSRPFEYFREGVTKLSAHNVAVVLQDNNMYTRIFGPGNKGKIFRSGVFGQGRKQRFNIYLPNLDQTFEKYEELEIRLLFENKDPIIESISYGGKKVLFKQNNNTLYFRTKDYRLSNTLILETKNFGTRVIEIEGQLNSFVERYGIDSKSNGGFVLRSGVEPWRYAVTATGRRKEMKEWDIWGTLSAGFVQNIVPLATYLDNANVFYVDYSSYNRNREHREIDQVKINTDESQGILIAR